MTSVGRVMVYDEEVAQVTFLIDPGSAHVLYSVDLLVIQIRL